MRGLRRGRASDVPRGMKKGEEAERRWMGERKEHEDGREGRGEEENSDVPWSRVV